MTKRSSLPEAIGFITGRLSAVEEASGHGLVADVEVEDLGAGADLLLELLALWTQTNALVTYGPQLWG